MIRFHIIAEKIGYNNLRHIRNQGQMNRLLSSSSCQVTSSVDLPLPRALKYLLPPSIPALQSTTSRPPGKGSPMGVLSALPICEHIQQEVVCCI